MKDLQSSIVQKLGYFGPEHTIACFRLNLHSDVKSLLVSHEGFVLSDEMSYFQMHHGYPNCNKIKSDLGNGLTLVSKEHSSILKRGMYLYEVSNTEYECILAFPATGEELYFEIYALDYTGAMHLILSTEL